MSRICLRWCLTVLMWAVIGPLSAQTLAITFDDGFDPRVDPDAARSNARMLDVLRENDIRAMLFPAGSMVDSQDGLALVGAWAAAGHSIGNHSYSHRALSQYVENPDNFFADVLRAQAMFAQLPGWCPRLRYPYLDEGQTPELKDRGLEWLAQHGYGVAAATIFIEDWTYNESFISARRTDPNATATPFRQKYLEDLWQQASVQENAWSKKLGRSPRHVLLLHANTLNAILLPDILSLFRSHGWTFVEPETAFSDPVYSRDFMQSGQARVLPKPACR